MLNSNAHDADEIRQALQDYYGTAMMHYPAAVLDLVDVDDMTNEQVINAASRLGII